ncbi:MAG: dihydroorotate dehydrogenase (quinone) [Bacteriovoracaceae bacterium]|jgi:dihydroorotate dehydrogenase|nr:dihydroorotate dehydrogenase (quinone) [Bacteriovoracaceae bacterium]
MLVKFVNGLSKIIDPETVHELTMNSNFTLRKKEIIYPNKLGWKNPIGLAAGFDKNAKYVSSLDKMGFGAIEIGTITPKAQIGNPRPRIKKLKNNSILNWMGFPNEGMDKIYDNLKRQKYSCTLGVNIGKNKETPNADAHLDYLQVAKKFNELCDYFVINISSPNTQNLRDLQNETFVENILALFRENSLKLPYFKVAPDLEEDTLIKMCKAIEEFKGPGIITTNTSNKHEFNKGGISGNAIKDLVFNKVSKLCEHFKQRSFSIIACGGIDSKEDIRRYKSIGVDNFQIYSSFVYKGPKIILKLIESL